MLKVQVEAPRDCRSLHFLRGWSRRVILGGLVVVVIVIMAMTPLLGVDLGRDQLP
jgi:hypothetical protein